MVHRVLHPTLDLKKIRRVRWLCLPLALAAAASLVLRARRRLARRGRAAKPFSVTADSAYAGYPAETGPQ